MLIEVTSLSEVDPFWTYTDNQGHIHKWHFKLPLPSNVSYTINADDYSPHLPTLKVVNISEATEEYPAIVKHICRKCGETIYPGKRVSPVRRYISADITNP